MLYCVNEEFRLKELALLARLKTQGVGWTKSTPNIIAVRSTNELNTKN